MGRDEGLLRKIGDRIALEPETYDQNTWYIRGDCGTVACVAGHAAIYHPGFPHLLSNISPDSPVEVEQMAMEVLGLTQAEAHDLFSAYWKPRGYREGMAREEVATLVRDALYALADGASIEAITEPLEDDPSVVP